MTKKQHGNKETKKPKKVREPAVPIAPIATPRGPAERVKGPR
ncbi:MAG: hypothetical protein AB9M60_21965 [Leptothrix sp. (in: b-proteobacteria)]